MYLNSKSAISGHKTLIPKKRCFQAFEIQP